MCLIMALFMAITFSAQAATVFKKDNFTYKIKGDWQIQFRKDTGKDQDLDVEYDDLEIKNSVSYELNDTLTAFGELDFGFKNAADKSNSDDPPHLEEAYLGFKIQAFKLFFGKTTSAGDDFGITESIETIVADHCFDEFGAVEGDDIVGASGEIADIVKIYATYEIDAESEKSDANGTFFDILVTAEFSGVSLGAAYQTLQESGSDKDINTWGVQAGYDAKYFEIGADFSMTEDDNDDTEKTVWNVAVAVPIKPVTIAAGYVLLNVDDGTDDEEEAGWYGNVTYKFPSAKNVSIFAEISDSDKEEVDVGYLLGARIKF